MISARDKWKEAQRELELRKRVYPRFIDNGKLTLKEARRQIAVMEAIAEDFRQLAEHEEVKDRLL